MARSRAQKFDPQYTAASTKSTVSPAAQTFTATVPPVDPENILTLAEVSSRLKVSERWTYEKTRRRCRNPLPCLRIGRFLRFDWGDVSAWLRQQSTFAANKRAA
jgi:predicted DNA-binding transcriptional regulator AlpA